MFKFLNDCNIMTNVFLASVVCGCDVKTRACDDDSSHHEAFLSGTSWHVFIKIKTWLTICSGVLTLVERHRPPGL